MDDLISRQAAIDALHMDTSIIPFEKAREYADATISEIRNRLEKLPSAQPEIIRCKDCKHFIREDIEEYAPYGFYNTYFHAFCDKHWDKEQGEYIDVNLDDYCSFAERREVTS